MTMWNVHKFIVISLIIASFLASDFIVAKGEEVQELVPETLAVSLVIDTSGSMADTDPLKLRETAANIFIDLLSPEDYLGIITFDTATTVVQPLQMVNDSAGKAMFKQSLAPNVEARGDTNYKVALDEAFNQLAGLQESNVRKVVVFITDGEPDPDSRRKNEPGFMDAYMESLWGSVQNFAVNKFPVYAIGFSEGIRADVLSRIASDTGGDFKVLSDPVTLASSFFDILGNLKNRKGFINQTLELNADSGFDITLDEYTSQSTIVIANREGAAYEVEIRNPGGEIRNETANINKTDKYTIITMNNRDSASYGNWRLNLRGTGTVDVFGDRDLNIKSWLVSPLVSSQHPVKEPVNIEVNVTGELKDGISAIAYVTGADGSGAEEIILNNENGIFTGAYDKTETPGTYSIEVRVLLNGEIITSTQEKFNVRILPVLKNNFYMKEEGYRVGEVIGINSSLNMSETRFKQGGDLTITNYSLLISNEDGTSEQIVLTDDGQEANRDILPNDGIWSGQIALVKETTAKATLIVTGIYKNESFVLENSLGTYKVMQPGELIIEQEEEAFSLIKGATLSIPVTITNRSEFQETLKFAIEEQVGKLVRNKFILEPGETKETAIEIEMNRDTGEGNHVFDISLVAENELTVLNTDHLTCKVEVLSGLQGYLRTTTAFMQRTFESLPVPVLILAVVLILLLLIFLIGGAVLYRRIYLGAKIIGGQMICQPCVASASDEISCRFNFERLNKDKIIISFNEKNEDADYRIKGTGFNYDLVITSEVKKVKSAVLAGWRTLFRKSVPVEYFVKATVPGILEKNGEILTGKMLVDNDEFESGNHIFRYTMPAGRQIEKKEAGSNILEGRDEKG